MADEQAQDVVLPQTEPQVTETPNVSEDDKTQADSGRGQSDYQQAMLEERRKRQQLESELASSLNDKNFIYEQARRLGLTDEPAPTPPTVASPPPAPGLTQAQIDAMIAARLDQERQQRDHPDLFTDPDTKEMIESLVYRSNNPLKWADAVAKVTTTLDKRATTARSEGQKAKESEVSEKERAQTATSSASTSSDAVYEEELNRRTKSLNRQTQEGALIEKLMRRNSPKP